MSNNRIYPKEFITKAIADLKKRLRYCPKCFSNNIDYKEGNLVWFHEYKCFDCNSMFNQSEAITKDTMRDKKIKKVLSKK